MPAILAVFACVVAPAVGARDSSAPDSAVLQQRIEDLEARVEALERRVDELATRSAVPASQVPGPTAQSPDLAGAVPGWRTTLYPLDPNDPRVRRTPYGSYTTERTRFPLKLARQDEGMTARQPVGIENQSIFVPARAGWHSFGFQFTFPPVGFSGLLAGFECFIEIAIDDELVLETTVRMPYSLRNRVKDERGSKRLEARPYRVSEWIACQSDGRQSANPTDALDAIRLERMIKRPLDRRTVTADPKQFRVPPRDDQ